ncbi:MAG: ACP S-malonyltransferase [Candidatus Saccharimonadales bacterium]
MNCNNEHVFYDKGITEFSKSTIAIGFPGQGPHQPDKMSRLIREHPVAVDVFREAEEILERPVLPLLLEERGFESTTRDNQVRLYLGSSALWLAAQTEGIAPVGQKNIFFGASAGEYAALMAAGAYDFATGLSLIDARGEEMHKASIINPGEMLIASGLPFEEAKKIAKGFPGVYAVNDNPGMQTVFSGTAVGIRALSEHLSDSEIWGGVRLDWPAIREAAHSWHMSPAVKGFSKTLRNAKIKKPPYDFMGNQAKVLRSARSTKKHLAAQLTRGVLLTESARQMREDFGVDTFVDVGPGKVLLSQMRRQFRKSVRLISIVDELLPEKNSE